MRHVLIPVTAFAQNCSLVWCERTGQAALIDPGGEPDRLIEAARERRLTLATLLLTHGHVDHVGAADALSQRLGIPVIGPHRDDAFLFDNLPGQARAFGFPPARAFEPQRWLEDGDRVAVGEETLEVLHCPGHTPGHVVFFNRTGQIAFVGDVLFAGSIGRTDFPGGDHAALIGSIREKLLTLGDAIRFVPGHGPLSDFGRERRTNPFLRP